MEERQVEKEEGKEEEVVHKNVKGKRRSCRSAH